MASLTPEPIPSVVPPWTLKGTAYVFFFYVPSSKASTIPRSFLTSELEANSEVVKGEYLGGLATIQVIRYAESPVGPYDEMLLAPGKFSWDKEIKSKDGKSTKVKKEQNLRITRIYVSQKHTCFNGRKSMFDQSQRRFWPGSEFNTKLQIGTSPNISPPSILKISPTAL